MKKNKGIKNIENLARAIIKDSKHNNTIYYVKVNNINGEYYYQVSFNWKKGYKRIEPTYFEDVVDQLKTLKYTQTSELE
jgi:hypothetical protein